MNDIMTRINANDRLVGLGAVILIVSWMLGIVTFRFVGFWTLPFAVIALVILFLKYSPDAKFEWPVPVALILLILGALATFGAAWGFFWAVIGVLIDTALGFNAIGFVLNFALSIAILVGAGLMLYGSYKEYNVTKTA